MEDMPVKKLSPVRKVLFSSLLAVFLAAAVMLAAILLPRFWPQDVVEPMSSLAVSAPSEPEESEPELPDNPKDFAALAEKYPGIVGWISVPGTVIDYPVVRSSEDPAAVDYEENYYLTRRPDRSKHKEGSVYMQKLNEPDFSDPNTVLYGHNMASGRMFAALHKFKKAKFFEENQYIYIYAPGKVLTYRIYSIFVYDDRHILNSFNFYDPAQYEEYLQYTLNPTSMTRQVREGVEVTTEDYILTLSTCTNRSSERLILEGVLVDAQFTK